MGNEILALVVALMTLYLLLGVIIVMSVGDDYPDLTIGIVAFWPVVILVIAIFEFCKLIRKIIRDWRR